MDAITEARKLIESRLAELEAEREALSTALDSLGAGKPTKVSAAPRRQPRKARTTGKRAPRGQRQAQFLTSLSDDPGATMTEIARRMGVSPQQLYPIAHKLEQDGAIVKDANGYVPVDAAKVKGGAGRTRGSQHEAKSAQKR